MDDKRKENKDELSRSRRINIKVEKERQINEYYLKVSKRYRTVKFLSLGLLVVYLLGMLVLHRSQITYENLVYLMKDLDTDTDVSGAAFAEIKYDESAKLSTALYKQYLAAATTGSLSLFNTAGNAEREFKISMENPKVLSGDKYVMVYDIGGNSYSLYTSLVGVLSKQTEHPIQGAALSESGSFALICRSRENRYVINIYDDNFREVSKIYKDKYVMDAALSRDGSYYAVASCDVSGSEVICEVMSGKCDSENAATAYIDGGIPLSAEFFDNGSFCVVCDNSVGFFSKDGAKTNEISLSGHGLGGVSFCGNRVMIVESDDIVESSNTATVYDTKGEVLAQYHTDSKITSSALGEHRMFFAEEGTLTAVTYDGVEERAPCAVSVSSLVPFGDNVLVCSPSRTVTGFTNGGAGEPSEESETEPVSFEPIG